MFRLVKGLKTDSSAREDVLSELLYADDLVLMSQPIEGLSSSSPITKNISFCLRIMEVAGFTSFY